MFVYGLTILLSAFLLFQVQPLIARHILPWFGGSPAVWTTCMLFFQAVLLAGYAYAHLLTERLRPRRQLAVHGVVVLLSLVALPIIPDAAWKPTGGEGTELYILALLGAVVGAPYLLLSATSPLIQRWFSLTWPGRSPYRLYALSNVGSLAALLTYPVLVEPELALRAQAITWSLGYGAFVLLLLLAGRHLWQRADAIAEQQALEEADARRAAAPPPDDPTVWPPPPRPRPTGDLLTWIGLAAFPSLLLLATTNQISQEVAVVPFLWVLPLALYLLSFILCFESNRWYHPLPWLVLYIGSTFGVVYCLHAGFEVALDLQVGLFLTSLLSGCMIGHGELARSKPPERHLTRFYLAMSAGGALGGLFAALVAPRLFLGYHELHVGLAGVLAMALVALWRRRRAWLRPRAILRPVGFALTAVVLPLLVVALWQEASLHHRGVLDQRRSFHGILTVTDRETKQGTYRSLRHGQIGHGKQYTAPDRRRTITSYYGLDSGVGLAWRLHAKALAEPRQPMRLGVIGLGVGTLAAYGQRGDAVRFYELNPDVVAMAREHFTYLSDSPAQVDVVLGDARLELERELAEGAPQQLDVLAVDAFSSDAIPVHLLTRESFALYARHLAPGGVLAVHITNRFLDLRPVCRGLAEALGWHARWIDWPDKDNDPILSSNDWVLVTADDAFVARLDAAELPRPWPEDEPQRLVWTDDFSGLWQVLKR